jgi:hypothetical protein
VPNLIVDPERYVSRGSNAQAPFERSDGDCALELSCVESLRFNSWAMNTTASEGQSPLPGGVLRPKAVLRGSFNHRPDCTHGQASRIDVVNSKNACPRLHSSHDTRNRPRIPVFGIRQVQYLADHSLAGYR